MRWMWIIPGLLMALAAIGLIGVWGRRFRRPAKGEVSLMATVKRVAASGADREPVTFEARGQEIALTVPEHLARQLFPGQRGVLTYSGTEFIYFVPREELFTDDGTEGLAQVS